MQAKVLVAAMAAAGLCVPTALAQDTIYFSDFESDDGGWVNSGSGAHPGEWEWEPNYDSSNYTGGFVPPDSAFSGTGMWGTGIYDDYSNSGEFNILSNSFDFSGWEDVELEFASWSNLNTTFDYSEIRVNGDLVAGSAGSGAPQELFNDSSSSGSEWVVETVDLSAYDGLSDVDIEFRMFASTVVNRAGWYIDDVELTGIPTPGTLALLGLGGVAACRRRR